MCMRVVCRTCTYTCVVPLYMLALAHIRVCEIEMITAILSMLGMIDWVIVCTYMHVVMILPSIKLLSHTSVLYRSMNSSSFAPSVERSTMTFEIHMEYIVLEFDHLL